MGFSAFVLSYLLGSIPFGLLAGLLAGKDVRLHGSKNIGATNVWRVCGRGWGLATFVLDFLKGFLAATIVGRYFGGGLPAPYPALVCAVGAVLGHNFPAWLRFKGGKGVATSAGTVAGIMWLPFCIAFTSFIVVVAVSRYLSLGSMLASLTLVAAVFAVQPDPLGVDLPLLILSIVLAAMIVVRHRANIARIANGTENRFPPPKTPT